MRSCAPIAARELPLSVVAAVTTWSTLWSWRGFSTDWRAFLGPLLAVAVTVSIGGVALRCLPVSRRADVTLHVLGVLGLVWVTLGGSVIHPLAASHEIVLALRHGWVSAATNVAPVPGSVPSIAPLVIVCGAAVLCLVDVLACRLHRVPLAGLALVAVYAVPIIGLDEVVPWPAFAIPAAGFLLMLFLQQSAHVSRWERPLGVIAGVDPKGSGGRFGTLPNRASLIGAGAVLLAVTLPVFIPTVHFEAGKVLHAGGSGDSVKSTDLMTTMRRGLQRGKDVPLLDVVTDDPDPSYLRLGVLTRFDGERWTSGSRPVISDQVANGTMPILEQGLSTGALEETYQYTVTAASGFDSTWLPTQFPVSRIVAPGTWNYDLATMDVFAGDSGTNAAGITYQMTAEVPRVSAHSLSHALAAPPDILATYTAPAEVLPPQVYRLAVQVTHGLRNPYRMAVRLQDWFRTTGGFRYDLQARSGDDDNALVDFLTRGDGGRVGYCEQFASAYAAMAQVLGIPARVAVGYLIPTQTANGDWVYSAYDYHAWPELYFQGSGWVRFEPTPAARAAAVPPWTQRSPTTNPGHADQGLSRPSVKASKRPPPAPQADPTTDSPPSHPGLPRAAFFETLGVLLVLVMLLPIPGAVRRSRRTRRLAGGAEDAWTELHDTTVDLGLSWRVGRSPHQTGARLAEWFAAEQEDARRRPLRGAGHTPEPERALDRIVLMLEQVRYAPSANDDPGALTGDVLICIQALEQGRPQSRLVRARWLPRSVFSLASTVFRAVERQPEASRATSVHDHIE